MGRGGAPHGWAARHVEAPLSPFVPHGERETDAFLVTAVPARTFATIDSHKERKGTEGAHPRTAPGVARPSRRAGVPPAHGIPVTPRRAGCGAQTDHSLVNQEPPAVPPLPASAVFTQWKPPRRPPRHDEHRAAGPQPKERGCVRRGPAAAAPKPRRHPLESDGSHAANLLRLVLRAHSRAPGEILAAREGFAELE